MITTGLELKAFITSLNAEDPIEETLLDVLVDNAKTIVEEERPWMVLRKTNSSISVTDANTWETAHSLAGITDLSRFYGEFPIRLLSSPNVYDRYHQVPFDRRIEYKDVGGTFIRDLGANALYLNGIVANSGTLYINYIATTPAIDLSSNDAVWTAFPSRFLPLLGYYAVGIYKGGVDYDTINKLMLPTNQQTLNVLKNAMEKWDNELQLNELEFNDPTDPYGYPRLGTVGRD